MIFMIRTISNLTNQTTMHTSDVQAAAPAGHATIFSRAHSLLRRTLVLALLAFGLVDANAQQYVFIYKSGNTVSFLRNNSGSIQAQSDFGTYASTCIFTGTGTASSTFQNGNYYLYRNNNTLQLSTYYTTTWTITTYGRTYNSNRYIRYNNNGWTSMQNNSNPGTGVAYTVLFTYSNHDAALTNPTITGADVLTATGTSNYSVGAKSTPQYHQFDGYSGTTATSYYWYNNALQTAPPTESNVTSGTWTLEGGGTNASVNASTGQITVSSLPATDLTMTLTCTVTSNGITKSASKTVYLLASTVAAPTITRAGNNISLATSSVGATIYYTTDGSTPTSSSTAYSGPFSIEALSFPVTIKAIAIRNGNNSSVTTETYSSPACEMPQISISTTGAVTISCPTEGATIRYTTNGTDPTESTGTVYSGTFSVSNLTTVKAIAYKTNYTTSAVATNEYLTSGTSSGKVILNDYEDHSWSYYSDPDCPIRSLNPADVKITYHGRGTGTISTTNGTTPASNSWTQNATNVQVSYNEADSIFIYYKTLERTDGSSSANPTGRCEYTAIPNPFSVRPTYTYASGTNNNYCGFYKWRVKSLSGGTIHTAATGGNSITVGGTIDGDQTIYFAPDSEYGMEVELEALWARAYVTTGYTSMTNYVTGTNAYERNFHIVTSTGQTASNYQKSYPATISSRYPNGTSGGGSFNAGSFSADAETKIEYLSIGTSTSNTWSANGKNFIIGRGVSGTVNTLLGLSNNATNDFKLRVESGTFKYLQFLGSARTFTGLLTSTLGSDYDRAGNSGNGDNTKLAVTYDIVLSNSSPNNGIGSSSSVGKELFNCTVKSGNFDVGVYGEGRQFYCSVPGGKIYGRRNIIVEGGIFSDISGGTETVTIGDNLMFDLRVKGNSVNPEIRGVTYGAAQEAAGAGHRKMVITGGLFKGWIAGGANGTSTTGGKLNGNTSIYFGGNAQCNSNGVNTTMGNGAATGGNIFGAGSGNTGATGTSATVGQVDQSTIVIADNAEVERNVYGGGNYGYVTGTGNDNKSDIYILGGTVNGSVFGGSNMQKGNIVNYTIKGGTVKGGVYGGSNANGNLSGGVTMNISGGTMEGGVFGGGYGTNSNSCDVAGTVDITMTGGTVLTGLYGGGNVNSTVSGVTTVSVNGGTIGASNARANVHGGGLGSLTRIRNSVVVNIGVQNATSGATIYGDVYGGSAEGKTNGNTAQENSATTAVTLNAGTINGSLYGGGLGTTNNPADVYGPVSVIVNGGSVNDPDGDNGNPGSIFGCNNAAGSPQSTVSVTIYSTDTTVITNGIKSYAINGVYGGGNEADYTFTPANNTNSPTVTINGCESSIKDVYGGGNAASVPQTLVTINGGDINRVFGGGNGERGANYPAHVGRYTANNTTYGTGKTNVTINGGTINQVFGGSNSNGEIKGEINVNVASAGTCTMDINEVYGGGNQAASRVGTVTIGCMNAGDTINYVYGGSNDADITGNVSLLIKGGHIKNVFGGNNTGHSISGSITVTVDWSQGSCTNNYLGNVFGGGNLATIGTAQSLKAPTVYIYDGTVSGNVYGGGKGVLVDGAQRGVQGKVTGNPTVVIGDSNNSHKAIVKGDVYGGGDAADVAGVPVVTVNDCNSEVGNVYGGGNAADINGATVTINGGTIGDVFGGGHGDKDARNPSKYADVNGNVTLNVYGGTIERVFAGSNSRGQITGTSALTINKSSAVGACDMKIGEVYGGGNEAAGKASTINIGCTGEWTTNHTNADTISNRIGYELEGIGYVYGGANQANIGTDQDSSDIVVTINSGIVANVFGGNNTSGTIYGTIAVNIEKTSETGTCGWYVGNVFGGGNLASYSGSPAVNIKNGLVSLNVYGGGKGSSAVVTGNPLVTIGDNTNGHSAYVATVGGNVYGGGDAAEVSGNTKILFQKGNNSAAKLYGGGNAAGVSGTATVDMQAGTVTKGIYGGCDSIGTVQGAIAVNITGGTIGANGTPANVHGGGYGSGTDTEGNVTVTINGSEVNIWGDVYGGSGLGDVNDAVQDTTTVHLQAGTVHGDIYGGGLGDSINAALVKGTVNVTIDGGTVTGKIFGCNNENGTPKGVVTVTINGTDTPASSYALSEVYGGGNKAHYVPNNGITASPKVIVNGCDNSIGVIYGGGNAANVPSTDVTIWGGTIGQVFGGGHGNKDARPATEANVNGDVTVKIYGGTITEVFGGSNSKGTITGTSSVVIKDTIDTQGIGNHCAMSITDVYGGGNQAEGNAGTLNIGCGSVIRGNVYGGAKEANVNSDIHLIITGGTLHNVFGGNNIGGEISGSIIVDINQGDCDSWHVDTVYGGGNLAYYTPDDDGQGNLYPQVNIINGTVSGNVFGGGYGSTARVTANPRVNLIGGTVSGNIFGGGEAAPVTGNPLVTANYGSVKNLFGGGLGSSAVVTGNPSVEVNQTSNKTLTITEDVFGGGDAAAVTGTTSVTLKAGSVRKLFGGGNAASVRDSAKVTLTSGNVTGGVYGGCNSSDTVGVVKVLLNGGQVGTSTVSADVYGGGFGASTETNSKVFVTLNGTDVYGDIYGGSALGHVNAQASDSTIVIINTATLHGNVFGGGKGDDNTTAISNGNATLFINANDSTNRYLTGVYGGANINGLVSGNIQLNINANIGAESDSLDIFGGGYGALTQTGGNVTVNVGNGSNTPNIHGDIYGGSALGSVNDAADDITTVNVLSGTVNGNIYGGGLGEAGVDNVSKGQVNGQVIVNIGATDGAQTPNYSGSATINGSVYGCNNTNGSPKADVTVNVYQTAHNTTNAASYTGNDATYAIQQVFGGGNQADYSPTSTSSRATVNIYTCFNTIGRVFGGGNAAAAYGVVTTIDGGRFDYIFGGGNGESSPANIGQGGTNLTVNGGTINYLFGGSNEQGTILGTMGVTVNNTGDCGEDIKNFFAGGNLAVIGDSDHPVTLETTIDCGTNFGSVYGGSNLADIYGNIILNINGGTIDTVFAGSKGRVANQSDTAKAANIYGSTTLNIYAGAIGSAFGGSNINGNISGPITVNMEWDDQNKCAQKSITDIFGASNLAIYRPTTPGNYPAVNIKHGTVSGSVFGAGNGDPEDPAKGIVYSNPVVTIGVDTNAVYTAIVVGNVYGGGNNAAVSGNTSVTYNDNNSNSYVAKLFGGGNAANVSGTTTVTLTNGKVTGGVYGGCNSTGSVGAVTVALNGGQVGVSGSRADVFGGGYGHPTTTKGDIGITLGGTTVYGDIYGGSALGSVNDTESSNTTTLTISSNTLHGTIYGGGMGSGTGDATRATSNGSVVINYNTENTNLAGLYGGANVNGIVSGDIEVNITANVGTDASHTIDIFGGGLGAETATNGDITVTIDKGTGQGAVAPTIYGSLYGGSSLGEVGATGKTAKIDFKDGTLNGNIYGGGKGQTSPASISAAVTGGTEVAIGGGSINGSVYGGCNENGSVTEKILVNLTGGTIGTSGNTIDIVFGGGYGASTSTNGNVTVTVNGSTIHGHVYGGSALGSINDAVADSTTVNVLSGTVNGNIYGGGLGEAGPANVAKGQVNGQVIVNIGATNGAQNPTYTGSATINGSVYGCNNTNGSPKANVTVNVYKTAQTSGTNTVADTGYAIDQVFGGGNQADYSPTSTESRATVHVYTCDNTIRRVFGGGNAAAAFGVVTVIEGGRFYQIFGGGNGEVSAANIGNGGASLTVNGGYITQLFGGSNSNGTINGPLSVNISNSGCGEEITEFFAGGNLADITGDINTTIQCSDPAVVITNLYGGSNLANITGNVSLTVNGGTFTNVFGGSKGRLASQSDTAKAANITGNVTLNLNGGTMTKAFGGSNINGNITGKITVNMNDSGNCDLSVSNVYGAGKDASYTPTQRGAYPEVNILNGTVSNNVYGGGLGNTAIVHSNPTVTIGDLSAEHSSYAVTVTGDVYGGGDAAGVDGNTSVTIQKTNTVVGNAYGGGNAAGITGTTLLQLTGGEADTLFGGGRAAGVTSTATVIVSNGTVTGGIYGGCNASGNIGGKATVSIIGGNIGTSNDPVGIYGGGMGAATRINGDVEMNIGTPNANSGATIYGDIYGGSAKGITNSNDEGTARNGSAKTDVNLNAGTVHGSIYGGGHGIDGAVANVWGPVVVTVDGGSVLPLTGNPASIFGCNNLNGSPKDSVVVRIVSTAATQYNQGDTIYALNGVYGGGNQAHYEPSVINGNYPKVTISCDASINDVFGGGNAAAVPNTNVIINGGDIRRVFAGGNGLSGAAHVGYLSKDANPAESTHYGNGNTSTNIYGGNIRQIFAGSNANGVIHTNGTLNINKTGNCAMIIGEVYGGGNMAKGKASEISVGCTGDATAAHISTPQNIGVTLEGIGTIYGGANAADIGAVGDSSHITLRINSGMVGNVFGGNNSSGDIYGKIQVIINQTSDDCGWYVGNVFGGGNMATYAGTPTVTITNGEVSQNVYGGGNMAGVAGTLINMDGGTVKKAIYGGCNTSGTVTGPIAVNINNGTVGTNLANTNHEFGVFGGGYGASTATDSIVIVTIGNGTIYGDVYGGSALGNVNRDTAQITKVWLQSGTVNGSIYGGGLGNDTTQAFVYGKVQVVIDGGTVTDKVFGCNNVNGTPKGQVTVTVNGTDTPASGYALNEVYGGGNMATYTPATGIVTSTNYSPKVIVNDCNNSIGVVYGGGNAADVPSTDVTIWGGTFNQVFGGGHGNQSTNTAANVNGNVLLTIHGGTINEVFGGSNSMGNITGSSTVNVEKDGSCPMSIVDVYGGGNLAAGKAGTLNIGCGAVVTGNVYGGAKKANVNSDIYLKITGGNLHNVFGGNNMGGLITGTITVDIDKDINCDSWHVDTVYGGGNIAAYTAPSATPNYPQVNIKNGTVTTNVFGGGLGEDARVTGNPHVYMLGGVVNGNVYGGGEAAPVTGNPVITASNANSTAAYLYGGGKGATAIVTGNDTVVVSAGTYGYVFGGGEAANQTGNVVVNIQGGTITNDVYGGGALANTNTSSSVSTPYTTIVNLTGGTMANAYGGGLGNATTPALVYGKVYVNLNPGVAADSKGAVINDYLFGCNNINGSPKDSVTVHVYSTQNSGTASVLINNRSSFDMKAVYGGGNMAAYVPINTATPTHVIIDGCHLSSIEYVYGGGNAAPVPATVVDVFGSDTIGWLFGGGNGKDKIYVNNVLTDNPGADVGIYEVSQTVFDTTAARLQYNDPGHEKEAGHYYILYGDTATSIIGTTNVTFYGGVVGHMFGGSNTKGDIIKEAKVILGDEDLKTCEFSVEDVYGGSNEAYMSGRSGIDMNCTDGMSQIYGGSRMADVHNNIVLTINGGHYKQVFGGNNLSGRIYGSITVNIEQTGCLPIEIDELYGGGNQAGYSVYGYDGNNLKEGDERLYADPQINIVSFKSIGKVFGGGLGETAIVVGNPTININTVKGWTNGHYQGKNSGKPDEHAAYVRTIANFDSIGVIDTVFGGGNQAIVKGETFVYIGTKDTVTVHNVPKSVYDVITAGNNGRSDFIPVPTYTAQDTIQDLTITVEGVNIKGNVYGGGNNANVTGGTHVIVGKEQVEVTNNTPSPAPSPAPRRTQEPAQSNQPQQPQNAATESQQTRSINATRQ